MTSPSRSRAGRRVWWPKCATRTSEAIRNGHNKGLEAAERSSDLETNLRTFEWTVESGPPAGGILPDCVVIAFDAEGKAGHHLLMGVNRLHAVVMAVSHWRSPLLVHRA